MQSGISVSTELQDAFKGFVSDRSKRGLLVGIANEKMILRETIKSTSDDFSADLGALDGLLKDNEATYVILRRYPDAADSLIAITYVPDTANVRSKMLFASSRLSLVRELGSDKFRETLFATTKAELTAKGFKDHDKHGELNAPLTEEERLLQSVKDAEAEESQGTSSRSSHVMGVNMPVSVAADQALKAFVEGSNTLLQLKLDIANETVELASAETVSAEGLGKAISNDEGRYSFFKYEHTSNGESTSPVVFIYTCPEKSKIKERMVYATSRISIVKLAELKYGFTIAEKMEATDPSEITPSSLEEALNPPKEEKSGFSRPKRPGKK